MMNPKATRVQTAYQEHAANELDVEKHRTMLNNIAMEWRHLRFTETPDLDYAP